MIKRSEWGAKPLNAYTNTIAPPVRANVVIHHSVTSEGGTKAKVEAILRQIDNLHRSKGWGGIGYNLAVDYDGRIYEARGIDIIGCHASGMNTKGYGVCYIGDGRKGITEKGVAGIRSAINTLQNHSAKQLKVVGHRDINSTECPSEKIYSIIKSGGFVVNYPLVPVKPSKPPVKPEDGNKYIVVRAGDSYWSIAVRVLGVPNTPIHYPKIIKESNRIKSLNNNKPLQPGHKVRIK